jgi:hypothetical protein
MGLYSQLTKLIGDEKLDGNVLPGTFCGSSLKSGEKYSQ